ncbi:MAG: hypothetical protein ACUVX9_03430 [Anaerolineae bacterium]
MAVRSLEGVVTGLMAGAIEFCAAKTGLASKEQVSEALGGGDCQVCEYLRHGLALRVASYLADLDPSLRAVYSYDGERTAGEGSLAYSPGINLIARVQRKSAALEAAIRAIGAALGESWGTLGCPYGTAACHTLDVRVVDEAECESRSGYGALLGSVHVRPTEIWRR